MSDERYTFCPGCDSRILPGQDVVGVDDPDPDRCLWHRRCRSIKEYDDRLARKMKGSTDDR